MQTAQSNQVLIVEDVIFNQMAAKLIVASANMKPIIAADGEIAVKCFRENRGNFALILMDLHMPNLDGFEASKQIREIERSLGIARTKIIGLSGDDDDETRRECLAADMDGLIGKPLRKDFVIKMVKKS